MAAYGYLAPPKDKNAPALAVGVWMGNSDNSPNDGKLSLDTSAPLWSAILTDISKGLPIAKFKAPERPQDGDGRCVHRARAERLHDARPSRRCSCPARARPEVDEPDHAPRSTRRAACSGRTAASGRKVTKSFFDVSEVDSTFPTWQKADRNWAARAARGAGVRGPEGHPDGLLLQRRVRAVRAIVGRVVRAVEEVPARAAADACDPLDPLLGTPCPTLPPEGGGGGVEPPTAPH